MLAHVRLPSPRRATVVLTTIVLGLLTLSVLGQLCRYELGHARLLGLIDLVYVDEEANLPAWYSSMALLGAAALLALIAYGEGQQGSRFRAHWWCLAWLFLGLSVDEVAVIHELSIEPLRQHLGADGALRYAWVLPGGAFVAVLGFAMLRFLRHLPAATRWAFVLAGGVFVGGALGVEMLSAHHATGAGEDNLTYSLIITLEEGCEMFGVVLFIRALLRYSAQRFGVRAVHVGAPAAAPPPSSPQPSSPQPSSPQPSSPQPSSLGAAAPALLAPAD